MHVEAQSGYRYYSMSQLPRLHRILALRDLGFPLDRIGETLEEGVSADALRGMLLLRQVEQQKQVEEETERLNRLNALIHLILCGILHTPLYGPSAHRCLRDLDSERSEIVTLSWWKDEASIKAPLAMGQMVGQSPVEMVGESLSRSIGSETSTERDRGSL